MLPVSDVIPPRTTPVATIALIAASTALFLLQITVDGPRAVAAADRFGLTPATPVWLGAATSLFVHAGWLPFLINMLCLWICGQNVEDRLGRRAFLLFYPAAGAAANAACALLQPGFALPLAGAGPAVAAVMGAYFVLFPGSQLLVVVHAIVYADVVEAPATLLLAAWTMSEVLQHLAPIRAPLNETLVPLIPHAIGFAIGAAAGALLRRRRITWVEERQ